MMSNDELVAVMVPKKHLSRVYGLIAELDGGSPPSSGLSETTVDSTETVDEWTPSRIRKMVTQTSSPAMRNILQALADRTGEWLTAQELADSIENKPDADWNTVAGTLGAFGRRVKNRYGLETWPFDDRYDHDAKGRVYRMSEEIAKHILLCLSNGR